MKRTDIYLLRVFVSSILLSAYCTFAFSQVNIRFDKGNFENWEVKVGYKSKLNPNGPYADQKIYPSNNNITSFPEYSPQNITGIKLVSLNKAPITDRNFDVFPDFNQQLDTSLFENVVKIGSPTVSEPLPLARKLSYDFQVTNTEKSFTYAYAILLEDGTHDTDQQPKFTAKVFFNNSLVECLSYEYQLPTNNGVIDEAKAIAEGFRKSKLPSETDKRSQRVWVRDWREMFIDLSNYVGNSVRIELEASNCIPAGHYAYAYVSISKNFGSPKITATKNICPGKKIALKVPNIKYASYEWKLINHASDFLLPGTNFNNYKLELQINPNPTIYIDEEVSVTIKSKCFADQNLTYKFDISKKAVGGTLIGPSNNLCEGSTATLNLTGYTGTKYILQKSFNKINWTDISPPSDILSSIETPGLRDTLSYYRIKIYNNLACPLDSSSIAIVKMDTKSIPGAYEIPSTEFCKDQFQKTTLQLKNYKSKIVNWEYSDNGGAVWNNINTQTDALDVASVFGMFASPPYTLSFRTNVSNGVCDTITKEISIKYNPNPFPGTTAFDTTICYGDSVKLIPRYNAQNDVNASFTWTSSKNLINDPTNINNAIVFPNSTQDFFLSIKNPLCPNALLDTFNVSVYAQMKIDLKDDKGASLRDPSIQDLMSDQAYVYNANTFNIDNNPSTFNYNWTIVDPLGYPTTRFVTNNNIATLTPLKPADFTKMNFVTILLKSVNQNTGCLVERKIIARIFNGPAQIFVPTAFTPNNDGLNDTFKPFIPGVVLKTFRIFNRFGKVIFETSDSNASWDGTYNGVPQNPGTYVWQATGTGRDGNAIKSQKGTVTLIR